MKVIIKVSANCNLIDDSERVQMLTHILMVQPLEGSGTNNPSSTSYTHYQVVDVPITATPIYGEFFHTGFLMATT